MIPQHSSKSDKWYSPPCLTDFARWYMGDIDLDPCSPPMGATYDSWHTVDATWIHAIDDGEDGLALPWGYLDDDLGPSRVFINHPGSRGSVKQWWGKLLNEIVCGNVSAFVWVCFNLEQLRHIADATQNPLEFEIWLPTKRIAYLDPVTGEPGRSPTHASALVCAGGLASTRGARPKFHGIEFARIS